MARRIERRAVEMNAIAERTAFPAEVADGFAGLPVQARYGYDDGFDWDDWHRRMGLPVRVARI
jgi:hypothetical protein